MTFPIFYIWRRQIKETRGWQLDIDKVMLINGRRFWGCRRAIKEKGADPPISTLKAEQEATHPLPPSILPHPSLSVGKGQLQHNKPHQQVHPHGGEGNDQPKHIQEQRRQQPHRWKSFVRTQNYFWKEGKLLMMQVSPYMQQCMSSLCMGGPPYTYGPVCDINTCIFSSGISCLHKVSLAHIKWGNISSQSRKGILHNWKNSIVKINIKRNVQKKHSEKS